MKLFDKTNPDHIRILREEIENVLNEQTTNRMGQIRPTDPMRVGQEYGDTRIYAPYQSGRPITNNFNVDHTAIKTGTSNINPNSESVKKIINHIKQNLSNITKIDLIGSASAVGNNNPNWGEKRNKQLAYNRANKLKNIIIQAVPGIKPDVLIIKAKVGTATQPESAAALKEQSVNVAITITKPGAVPGGVERDNTSVMLRTTGGKQVPGGNDGSTSRDQWQYVCVKVRGELERNALLDLLHKNGWNKGQYFIKDYYPRKDIK